MKGGVVVVAGLMFLSASSLAAQARDAEGKPKEPLKPTADFKRPLAANVTLNFADTIMVPRKADGSCDWSKTPAKPGKPGTSSYLAEAHNATCSGVVNNITSRAMPVDSGFKSDSIVKRRP